ncbi:MAG: hypothetical protein KKD99_04785 [Proteobacteria bacterium]|nr:hypothetical protein [Pseudomonadota bacterium]MBU4447882.1 hypothetical protein [Pseudomonadota bacterium]MCG2772733.1 hypothetical protein [Desulfobacterales bacterium]
MKNINLHAGVVAGGIFYPGRLVGGLLVCGLMSVCSEKFSVFCFLWNSQSGLFSQ